MTDRRTDGADSVAGAVDARSNLEPSTRVAYRLAEETGASIADLDPLAESVDPEALDALFRDRDAADAYVTFRHEGHTVTVTGDQDVLVDPIDPQ